MHCDYPKWGRHLHAHVALFYQHFKIVEDSPAKDGGVRVVHVDYVEGYHLCADLLAFGEKVTGIAFLTKASILFPTKTKQRIVDWF
jgi:hypothetical protein